MLGLKHVELIGRVDGRMGRRELAESLGVSGASVSRILRDLDDDGILEGKGGRGARIRFKDNVHGIILRELMRSRPRYPWGKILTYSALEVMACLVVPEDVIRFKGRTVMDIVEMTGLGRSTVYYIVKTLATSGIIYHDDGYRLHPDHRPIAEFVTSYWSYQAYRRVSSYSPTSTPVWHRGSEVMFTSDTPIDVPDVTPTGTTVLHRYGIPAILDRYTYLISRRSLSPEDHSLLTYLSGYGGRRHLTFGLLLIKAIRSNTDFLRKAKLYDIRQVGGKMVRFLEGEDLERPFPTREDFDRLCGEYGFE